MTAKEIIKEIKEVEGIQPKSSTWDQADGFQIVTNRQTITLAISNGQSCCEQWGYLITEDDPSKFVGAALIGLSQVDTSRVKKPIDPESYGLKLTPGLERQGLDGGDVMFIDIETDRGVFQFVAYNAHNGYYGHSVYVESEQLTVEDAL